MTGTGERLVDVETREVMIPLSDGIRLACRLFLPASGDPAPAILDFLPYRQGDLMIVRDSSIYPYFAARGYACARVDLRGTGNSGGIITDEYSEQEMRDGEEVIEWLSQQDFCDGAVGMTGISWGGFNSLQLAARRPPALKAILTLCASDDRYADDVHYRGGAVLALDMLQWAVSMLTWNALPPDPAVVGDGWREEWRRRVELTPAFIEPWLTHQRRDDYWRHGSVCESYESIEVPVYAVGGWADGYVDAVFRLLAGLGGPRRGLIGPWSHSYPNHSVPGPEIGFFAEALRWWDRWLKGVENGIDDEPMLVCYLQDYTTPAAHHAHVPGRFITEESWPPPGGLEGRLRRYFLVDGRAGAGRLEDAAGEGRPVSHLGSQSIGLDAGVLTADGGFGDWPGDQRPDDGASLAFTSAPLVEQLDLVGNAVVTLEVASDRPVANAVVRLCDVSPSGESLLVTRGMLNLTHRNGHDRVDPLRPGEQVSARIPLKAIAHRFRVGHHLRLAVSSTYWPWLWPPPEPVELTVSCGAGSVLELPVRPATAESRLPSFGDPEQTEPADHEVLGGRPTTREIVRDLAGGASAVVFDWNVGGHVCISGNGIEYDGSNLTTYRIGEHPLSAEVVTVQSAALRRAGQFDTLVETSGRMTSDAERFSVTLALDAREDGRRVMARTWNLSFRRDGV